MSKLFVTNHESRSAAKRYYRVHNPCTYVHMTCTYYGILYFNPEFDIIHIFEWWHSPELAHRIWKLYPLHVGIVNLAQQADQDYWDRRNNESWYTNTRHVGYTDPIHKDPDKLKVEIKRLKRVVFVFRGFKHLERWGVDNDPEVFYQIMMSYSECDPVIIDREDAIAFVEDEMEEKEFNFDRSFKGCGKAAMAAENILRQDVMPVFGFWPLLMEVIPVLEDTNNAEEQTLDFCSALQKQFKKHTPQLRLSHFPDYNPKILTTYERTEKDYVVWQHWRPKTHRC
ncbi:hypothetical protein NW764_006855 [Fusarium oxysporum]|nr:hypothetical protein NW764_006855 [Fusarium oxysporum]